jgi:hypothetical protein
MTKESEKITADRKLIIVFVHFSYRDSMKDLVVWEKPPVLRRQKEHRTHQKKPFTPPLVLLPTLLHIILLEQQSGIYLRD